ncbi:MAG TPA: hypothetical protein EYG99_00170 [Candidatus Pacebacteria bacterium]|nr:hypothetical protein [Candidatus Paceibacterota bacterium]
MSKGHKQGGKITGSHSTIIPAAERLVDFLQKINEIDKISIGFIKQGIKSGKHSIKIMELNSGLLLKVRGSASIQEIRIYAKNKKNVENSVKEFAQKYRYMCK